MTAMSALTATIVLPPVARSVPAARRLLGELLTAWAAERFQGEATLLLSELVTNVIRHVEGPANLTLRIDLAGPDLRVCVADSSRSRPTPTAGAGSGGGYGLSLVSALARRWGTEDHPDGKQVWFELGAVGGP
ncbi:MULTISPECIES: ATP-binding protein [unclassified Pseudonocardia]|jgi:anti-sigma regulatory factor (Ser/Thr protein kinase)|uniref:ATP-binding protein n=1 Tax=unclassified Pseudonocardia TaxID=2619320 RepID=UPI001ACEE8EE|nr:MULTISPECIES: ATP-binding protein [unclassified Pseudonocardia]MBN9102877.1 ATP-binding protein [Pseudonocardia sp.]